MTTLIGNARQFASRLRKAVAKGGDELSPARLPREDGAFAAIWTKCQPYTMTSFARGLAVFRAVRHVVENRIIGDFVECGVWRGGSSMIAMLSFDHFADRDRRVILFDTFEGMTKPGASDVDIGGIHAQAIMDAQGRRSDGVWCIASIEEVRENVARTGYPIDRISLVKGDIRETAPAFNIGDIAILRLDTDFYDSTKVELECFFDHLQKNGVLIVDDYGHWQGARRAVDEHFDKLRGEGKTSPMLQIIDYTGRIAIK